MTRREIKNMFRDMQLEFRPSRNSADELWRIPGRSHIIRIVVHYITSDGYGGMTASMMSNEVTHWKIGIKNHQFEEEFFTPEKGIEYIRDIIYDIFEEPFNSNWWKTQYKTSYTAWSTGPIFIPKEEKPKFYKPTQDVCKIKRNQNRPRVHRSSYAGRR